MEIYPGIEIRDLGLYLRKEKTLIISDLHIGFEESLNMQGILVPRIYFKDFMLRLRKMLDDVETVVINGDFKHQFGSISRTEWKGSSELFDLLQGKKIVIIQGNHDPILRVLLKNVKIYPFYRIGEILIAHGDEIMKEKARVIIIGHEHVAVGLKEGNRIERFKCFLKGKYKESVLIAMPSCNLATEGTDVLRQDRLSPYLQQRLDTFDVFIVSDTVYAFGKVKELPR